jgi:integrase
MPTTKRVRLTLSLIEQALRNPPPAGKTTFLRDSVVPGLALRIHPTGKATYTLLLPKGQRKRLLNLEREWKEYPDYWKQHLTRVREQASIELYPYRLHSPVHSIIGVSTPNPSNQRQRSDGSTKVGAVVREFTKRHLQTRTSFRHVRDSDVRFARFVLPKWKGRDITSITRKEVVSLANSVADEATPYVANRTLQLLSAMFNWGIATGLLEQNPASRVPHPCVEIVRDRVLSDQELALVWHSAEAVPDPWRAHLRLCILTGQRRGEVGSMRWDAINLEKAEWTLSARQTKSRRAHIVPLSPPALSLLTKLPKRFSVTGEECPWVFTTDGATPIGGYSQIKRRLDVWLAGRVERVEPWRVHDIRRTVATGLAELEVHPHVISAVLNHAPQGVTAQVYNRYSYAKEKREVLELWAKHALELAERYQPAPTEEELRDQERRQAMRRAWKREEAAARREGKPRRPKTLEEANTLALAAMAETAARRR